MTESSTTPESPDPVAQPAAAAAPAPQAAPQAVAVAGPPWRERFRGSSPALAVFAVGTLFGAILTGGVVAIADDDEHHRGPGMQQMQFDQGPGGMRGGDGPMGHYGR